jgi:peroxiredoxin
MLFDASGLLGNHRAQRYVAVVEDGKVVSLPLPSLSLCRYVRL